MKRAAVPAAAALLAAAAATGLIGAGAVGPDNRPEPPPPAAPASQAAPVLAGTTILLLGDSLAAGEGAGAYLTGTDQPGHLCHRSGEGLFAGTGAEVINVACSRARTEDLTSGQYDFVYNNPAEAPQLVAAAGPKPDATVVFLGANDIGFADIFNRCVLDSADCTSDTRFTGQAKERATEVRGDLERAYKEIGATVGGRILVPAYPQMFTTKGSCGQLSAAESAFAEQLTLTLNQSIRQAAEAASHQYPGVQFVPSTEAAFAGRGACDTDPLVHTVRSTTLLSVAQQQLEGQELLHPSAEGYRALTIILQSTITAKPGSVATPSSR